MRIGTKKKPFYRVVAVDERAKRTGSYLELVGTYNPLTEPKEINLKQDRIDYWIKQGAQPSDGYLRMIGKAPQRPPRKPKKEKKESPASSQQPAEEKVMEPTVDSQQPTEEQTPEPEVKEEVKQEETPVQTEPPQQSNEPAETTEPSKEEIQANTSEAKNTQPKVTDKPESAKK